MTSTGAIVLGYGGSAHSKIALTWAENLALQLNRPLVILVGILDVAGVSGVGSELAGAQVVRELKQLLDDSTATTAVRAVATSPSQALVRETHEAHLTVLGSRTHGPLASMVRGSVSRHVTRHAKGPVVVVRNAHTADARKVVIGADDSPTSRAALDFGFEHAHDIGSSVEVVHSRDRDSEPTEAAVRETVSLLTRKYPTVPAVVEVVSTPPAQALADASHSAELVVAGSRGRNSLAGILLGSVSQSVLEHAQCPVAIVR